MVTEVELDARRAIMEEGDLPALLATLTGKAAEIRDRAIIIPAIKAALTADGGVCPACGSSLAFDPWSPNQHRCSQCGAVARGERHDSHWARAQHLWVAERAAHLAAVAVIRDEESFAAKSRELLRGYSPLYLELPNRDNVLGPSHLFFSTYLESIWVLHLLAAAHLLRERGWLEEGEIENINAIADEAAALIGDFNEGLSNRQTWNAAALTAIAVWFGDEELGQLAIQSRTGLLGHLTDGFDDDGMWAEGENYHLFAIRGLLLGLQWAKVAGIDLLENPDLAHQLGKALMAPAKTALPDLTFPARKDARFGVSLAHPAYLECWEQGLAQLGDGAPAELASWLEALYQRPATTALTYDAYLHDAGEPARDRTTRADLSWWMLLSMTPNLPPAEEPWVAESALLADQGLAILRHHDRYLSLECGGFRGGHGHPDRLHLTVFADGVPWLADPGAGSYLTRDLFWYRSTLAHNAPLLGGGIDPDAEVRCAAFDTVGDWGWISASAGALRRRIVHGPDWLLDVVESTGEGVPQRLELPWHLDGQVTVETPGRWEPDELDAELVDEEARFVPDDGGGDVTLNATKDGKTIRLILVGGTLLRATGPGRPTGPPSRRTFYLARREGESPRCAAVLDFGGQVSGVEVGISEVSVAEPSGTTAIKFLGDRATVVAGGRTIELAGVQPPVVRRPSRTPIDRPIAVQGEAVRIDDRPPLDGSVDGFDTSAPLVLDDEAQYNRSEEPYPGPEALSATAYLNWDAEALYLAVEVMKPEVILEDAAADSGATAGAAAFGAGPRLDNEPPDIHLDGIQVYYRAAGSPTRAFLIRPSAAGPVRARPIPGTPAEPTPIAGGTRLTENGYCLTVALPCPELAQATADATVAFDLVINEARSGRVRRAGQLAWGGGHGWVYLRGDRRAEPEWGRLVLVG